MSFDHQALPRDYPRRFIPAQVDVADWNESSKLFDELNQRPIVSVKDLEAWLQDESELSEAIYEAWEIRYIRMTCHTDDAEREKAYLDFVENIQPKAKERSFDLDRKFVSSPLRKQLAPDRYFILNRKKENSVSLFRKENLELEKEEARLGQQYEKMTGAMTVSYQGQERTMQQMARYLEDVNTTIREEAWDLASERRLKDREALDKLFAEMLVLRHKLAENAGFDNYRDYAFRRRERFDYSPENCFQYHEAVEQHIVPLYRTLQERRQQGLGVEALRPWDLNVDPASRPPLRPFNTTTELIQRCGRIFNQIDQDFGRDFLRMVDLNLLDLDSRLGKAPGGYCYELAELRLPFIFVNSVGRDKDVRTLFHEMGHAFHTFATRDHHYHFQYLGENVPTEFGEVASQTMELVAGTYLEGTFYNHEDAMRSEQFELEGIVHGLAWIAVIDAFQHWIYTNPDHSQGEREEFWLKLHERFGGSESWEGYEDTLRSVWQRQMHLYLSPFYYIDYGIALLGALGLWTRFQRDREGAISAYKRALALGGSRPLPELFKAADLPFDFGPDTVAPYARELRRRLIGN